MNSFKLKDVKLVFYWGDNEQWGDLIILESPRKWATYIGTNMLVEQYKYHVTIHAFLRFLIFVYFS